MTLLEAAKLMTEACDSHTHTSLRTALRYMHERHPDHCAGKHDPFDALRACSCSMNQLISALLHGHEALKTALREPVSTDIVELQPYVKFRGRVRPVAPRETPGDAPFIARVTRVGPLHGRQPATGEHINIEVEVEESPG